MKKYLVAFAFSLGVMSCTPKKENTIAINVLIIPSQEMYSQALALNSIINQNNPETIKLDKKHVPHITLLQCFIQESDLQKVKNALEDIDKTIAQDSLKAESLFYDKDKEESFAMVRIEKTAPLLEIHTKAIELVKPFIVKNGSEASFVQNPDGSAISESTVKYVHEFVEKNSYENYDPHISLGVAQNTVLDSLVENIFKPIQFKAESVSVYQLGDHGTAQKLLWKSK